MREKSINEQLRERAEREGLIESDEAGIEGAGARMLLMPAMIGASVVLDVVGVLLLLLVSPVAGVAVLVLSATVLTSWLNLRLITLRRRAQDASVKGGRR